MSRILMNVSHSFYTAVFRLTNQLLRTQISVYELQFSNYYPGKLQVRRKTMPVHQESINLY